MKVKTVEYLVYKIQIEKSFSLLTNGTDFVNISIFRYDYEGVETAQGAKVIATVEKMIPDKSVVGKEYAHKEKKFKLARVEQFEYTDPVDKSVAKNEVISLPGGI